MDIPRDCKGRPVSVGSRVRLLNLSGEWFRSLPLDEKMDVESMIGEIFEVEEIDEYGYPWIRKSWSNENEGTCNSHSIAVESQEIEKVDE